MILSLLVVLFWISSTVYGQSFQFKGGRKKENASFILIKNLIIIPLYINGKGPYHFILDTGVSPLIITDISILDSLNLKSLRSTKLAGLGAGSDVEAYLTDQISVRIGSATLENMPSALLKTDIFNLSSYVGMRIYGLIGYYFFNSFTVRIRYPSKNMVYSLPEVNVKKKGEKIPMEIISNKPYIQIRISPLDDEKIDLKMILDIGASHAISLETYQGKAFPLPPKTIKANLGVGFAGLISGSIGRLNRVDIGSTSFKNVLASFPDYAQAGAKTGMLVRNGNVGSNLLKHFDLTLDYTGGAIYLKPNSFSKMSFEHDMSGMEVYLKEGKPNRYFVGRIEPDSPAEKIGILPDDEVLSLNFKSITEYSLDDIDQLLKSGDGKRMVFQLGRENTLMYKILILKKRI